MTMMPDPTFHASPKLAMEAAPESFAYTLLLSPDFSKPDALAVIATRPSSTMPFPVTARVCGGTSTRCDGAGSSRSNDAASVRS